mmetsp:Transcript_31071/g.68120  ORF Transcript_31071/g.68120 Transcript_31071/m.68120 type:complete len:213 (+) Transcript_31071:714-1352(+)
METWCPCGALSSTMGCAAPSSCLARTALPPRLLARWVHKWCSSGAGRARMDRRPSRCPAPTGRRSRRRCPQRRRSALQLHHLQALSAPSGSQRLGGTRAFCPRRSFLATCLPALSRRPFWRSWTGRSSAVSTILSSSYQGPKTAASRRQSSILLAMLMRVLLLPCSMDARRGARVTALMLARCVGQSPCRDRTILWSTTATMRLMGLVRRLP